MCLLEFFYEYKNSCSIRTVAQRSYNNAGLVGYKLQKSQAQSLDL